MKKKLLDFIRLFKAEVNDFWYQDSYECLHTESSKKEIGAIATYFNIRTKFITDALAALENSSKNSWNCWPVHTIPYDFGEYQEEEVKDAIAEMYKLSPEENNYFRFMIGEVDSTLDLYKYCIKLKYNPNWLYVANHCGLTVIDLGNKKNGNVTVVEDLTNPQITITTENSNHSKTIIDNAWHSELIDATISKYQSDLAQWVNSHSNNEISQSIIIDAKDIIIKLSATGAGLNPPEILLNNLDIV